MIAEEDASAAYWAYRILRADSSLRATANEDQVFMQLAIRNGHILARRDDVKQRMIGQKGISKIPGGLADYFRLFIAAYRAVNDEKKFLYT